jgi:hypothetical protein
MAEEVGGEGAPFGIICILIGIASFVLDFTVYLPRGWNNEMDQALHSMQAQNYPGIKFVSMDPWISVTFEGCNVKLPIDKFSGNWMPYTQSGGDGLFSDSGPKVPLSPYYIKNQFGCGLSASQT